MFGDNPKRAIEKGDGQSLKVQNIFLTLQGEGPYTGYPSLFIRLGGCNLACSFCDTEFESFTEISINEIFDRLVAYKQNSNFKLIVITGGEPFRQNIGSLCEKLISDGYIVQIESNGTLYQKIPYEVEVICSPKISNGKYHKIRDDLKKHIIGYKFLISKSIESYNIIPDWDFEGKGVYVQPIDEYDEERNSLNHKLAMDIALKNGYIFSIQMHKVIGIE